MKTIIGIMGSASGPIMKKKENIIKANQVGKHVALNDCYVVTGACPGLPEQAAKGAKEAGGFCIGISPAFSRKEHVEIYKSPTKNYDIIISTGFGLMERDILNIRTSDGIIILPGGVGTLNEFTIAYDEGIPMGILTNSDGVTNHINEILKMCKRKKNKNMFFEKDPKKLVEKLIKMIKKNPKPEYEDERVRGMNKKIKIHR